MDIIISDWEEVKNTHDAARRICMSRLQFQDLHLPHEEAPPTQNVITRGDYFSEGTCVIFWHKKCFLL